MRTRIWMLAMAVCVASTAYAQKKLTLEEAVLKAGSDLAPQRLTQLAWIPGTETLAYVEDSEIGKVLSSFTAEGQRIEQLLSLKELSKLIESKAELKAFPAVEWLGTRDIIVQFGSAVYKINLSSKTTEKKFVLPDEADHVSFNHDYSACAYVLEHNLFVQLGLDRSIQITKDGREGIVYGQSIHRNEFGINHGQFWSPDGRKLAFYRMDETMVDVYPLVDVSVVPAQQKEIRYPMAGRSSHHVQLGVTDISNGKVTYLKTGEPKDQYLCSVAWTPDSKIVLIGLLNRDQNHLRLCSFDAHSGNLSRQILEEKHEKYVEPEHPPIFLKGLNNEFIWYSERAGYQHVYLYDLNGELKRTITSGNWEVLDIVGLSQDRSTLFVQGTGEVLTSGRFPDETRNGTQSYVYRVDVNMATYTLLDSTLGYHIGMMNSEGTAIIDRYTSLTVPSSISTYTIQGKKTGNLLNSTNPLEGYTVGKVELITLPAGDGTTLYGRVIRPSNFDPTVRYPTLVYVYGGPHAQMVQHSWLGGAPLWMFEMAERGFIVATIDNRGSAHRGLEFEQSTFRNLGQIELADQLALIDYLRSQPWVNKERMAVHGWSYGGFMTINLLLTLPGVFKAGVAGGPVCDWGMYEVMYTERYMDTPQDNASGYQMANLVQRCSTLRDDLLVIHGTMDDVVVWQHSQAFLKACIDQGIQLDYFVYPGHAHNVRGKDRLHLMTKVLQYVEESLVE